jgi:3-mercaptopyruvate sulfurtransferase SseA
MKNTELKRVVLVVAAVAVVLCGQAFAVESGLVVDTAYVKDKIGKTGWVVVDMRASEDYSQGHIPGAVGLPSWVSKAFADDTKRQASSLARMEQTLGEMGIGNDSHVIVYGEPSTHRGTR